MILDMLAVFIITLISSLFLSTNSVHGLTGSSSNRYYIHNDDISPNSYYLPGHLHRHPTPNVDYDLGGDVSAMLLGKNNVLSTNHEYNDDNDDDNEDLQNFVSSVDTNNESLKAYLNSLPLKSLSRKLLLSSKIHHQQKNNEDEQQLDKRSKEQLISKSNLVPPHLTSKLDAASAFANKFIANKNLNLNQVTGKTNISPSLTTLIESNPVARMWLTILLQKLIEQDSLPTPPPPPSSPVPFKYGRRRKK